MKHRPLLTAAASAVTVLLAASAINAQAPQIAPLPDGMVAIHMAGEFKGWGLTAWESFEKIADGRPVPNSTTQAHKPLISATWGNPMKPTGKDGFGIYWHLKADEFKNGKVNYIIHVSDKKNCSSDMYFMSTETKEIFVNPGDCKHFTSPEAAMKARK